MTQSTFWIGVPSFAACLVLMIHTLVPEPPTQRDAVRIPWWSLLLQFSVECVSFFVWLACALPAVAWIIWIGDNPHWFYAYAWLFAAAVAVVVPGVAALRIARAGTTRRYLWIHLWFPIALVWLFGVVWSHEFLQRING